MEIEISKIECWLNTFNFNYLSIWWYMHYTRWHFMCAIFIFNINSFECEKCLSVSEVGFLCGGPWLCLVLSVGQIATSFLSCKDSCIWGSCRVLWGAGETALWPHTFPGMAWSTYSALQQTSAGWVRDTVKMVVVMHTENLFICQFFYTFLCSGYVGHGWRPGNITGSA